jgi:hypothetical protein
LLSGGWDRGGLLECGRWLLVVIDAPDAAAGASAAAADAEAVAIELNSVELFKFAVIVSFSSIILIAAGLALFRVSTLAVSERGCADATDTCGVVVVACILLAENDDESSEADVNALRLHVTAFASTFESQGEKLTDFALDLSRNHSGAGPARRLFAVKVDDLWEDGDTKWEEDDDVICGWVDGERKGFDTVDAVDDDDDDDETCPDVDEGAFNPPLVKCEGCSFLWTLRWATPAEDKFDVEKEEEEEELTLLDDDDESRWWAVAISFLFSCTVADRGEKITRHGRFGSRNGRESPSMFEAAWMKESDDDEEEEMLLLPVNSDVYPLSPWPWTVWGEFDWWLVTLFTELKDEEEEEEDVFAALVVPARGRDRTYVEANGATPTALDSLFNTLRASFFADDSWFSLQCHSWSPLFALPSCSSSFW